MREKKSFCRICNTHCGMVLTLDEEDRITAIRPDKDDPVSEGFACFKGLQAVESHDPENRVRHPLKRMADGSFERIGIEQALDEIAEKLSAIIERDGPEAVGGYRGTGSGFNAVGCFIMDTLFEQIGTKKIFSASTIDQTAKNVAVERIGFWQAGLHHVIGSDVTLLIGTNPLVSFALTFIVMNPLKHLKEEKAKGMKLLVIDPRETETAKFADIHVQPVPGEDATILAGMIRQILKNGWEDKEFVAKYVDGLEELRARVEPFTPDYVAERAGIDKADFLSITRTFATAKRGKAMTGTGANMGPHSNLVEHLLNCLNIICGRCVREGERIAFPGALMQGYPPLAQVAPAMRSYETSYKSRIGGYSQIPVIVPELPTGIMADEILQPGPGQVRAFFVHGGNPAVIVPDQVKMVSAFRSLELMVVIDPFMTPTAKLADYVLPTRLQYERADLPCWQYEGYWKPYTRYTPPIAKPAQGMEVVADEYIFWGLLKRLGKQMSFLGGTIPMDNPPDTHVFLSRVAEQAGRSLGEIRKHELGLFFEDKTVFALVGESDARFTLASPEVMEELTELSQEPFGQQPITRDGAAATHRLIVRRQRHMFNSISRELPGTHRRVPHNPAYLNPEDLAELGIASGDRIRITSRTASVEAIAEADPKLRRGCISMSHGYGDLPDANRYDAHGVAVNALLTTDFELQTVNAMPRMTAVPVHVSPAGRLDNAWADNSDGRVLQ